MDLSKAFDTLDYSLFFTNLIRYGFGNNPLSFVQSYLTNKFQRFKIANHFSNWHKRITGVPQGSILGSLLFDIFINNIFLLLEISNVWNYADDNILYAFGKTFDEVTRKLLNDFLILDDWFFNNFLVLNSDKCHLMTIGTPNTLPNFKCKSTTIKKTASG